MKRVYTNPMASNIDKVEDKAVEDMEEAIKSSKTREEIESKLDRHDLHHRTKDKAEQDKNNKNREDLSCSAETKGRKPSR